MVCFIGLNHHDNLNPHRVRLQQLRETRVVVGTSVAFEKQFKKRKLKTHGIAGAMNWLEIAVKSLFDKMKNY